MDQMINQLLKYSADSSIIKILFPTLNPAGYDLVKSIEKTILKYTEQTMVLKKGPIYRQESVQVNKENK